MSEVNEGDGSTDPSSLLDYMEAAVETVEEDKMYQHLELFYGSELQRLRQLYVHVDSDCDDARGCAVVANMLCMAFPAKSFQRVSHRCLEQPSSTSRSVSARSRRQSMMRARRSDLI